MSLYIHRVPGRIRLKSHAFQSDSAQLQALQQQLGQLEGVTSTRVNELAGSLVIRYQGHACVAQLDRHIDELEQRLPALPACAEPRTESRATDKLGKAVRKTLVTTAFQVLTRKLIERALVAI